MKFQDRSFAVCEQNDELNKGWGGEKGFCGTNDVNKKEIHAYI